MSHDYNTLAIKTLQLQLGELIIRINQLTEELEGIKDKIYGRYGIDDEIDNLKTSVDAIMSMINEGKSE